METNLRENSYATFIDGKKIKIEEKRNLCMSVDFCRAYTL